MGKMFSLSKLGLACVEWRGSCAEKVHPGVFAPGWDAAPHFTLKPKPTKNHENATSPHRTGSLPGPPELFFHECGRPWEHPGATDGDFEGGTEDLCDADPGFGGSDVAVLPRGCQWHLRERGSGDLLVTKFRMVFEPASRYAVS